MSTQTKPVISAEARQRISSFVHEVEALQRRWGVQIVAEISGIELRDTNRKDEFVEPNGMVYGEFDASVLHTDSIGGFRLENLRFEDFSGWGK